MERKGVKIQRAEMKSWKLRCFDHMQRRDLEKRLFRDESQMTAVTENERGFGCVNGGKF